MKSFKYMMCLFMVLQCQGFVAAKEEKSQKPQTEKASKKRGKEEEKASFMDRTKDWFKSAWKKVKTSFKKAGISIKNNTRNNFGSSERAVNKEWNTAHGHRKKGTRKQKRARRAEQEISHHHAKSERILSDMAESSDDPQERKHAQRYHNHAKRSKRDAESGREDLEFMLQNVARESERIEKTNQTNLELLRKYRSNLVEHQAGNRESKAERKARKKREKQKKREARKREREKKSEKDS